MDTILYLVAAAGFIGCIWLYIKFSKTSILLEKSENRQSRIRRVNANEREEKKSKVNLHTTESGNEKHRFFFDIKLDERGKKFLTISELEKEIGGEKGYTIVIFNHEIEGFKKAFERSYGFMKSTSNG